MIKIKGIKKLDKINMAGIKGGKECSASAGGTTYWCDSYKVVIDRRMAFADENADELEKHV